MRTKVVGIASLLNVKASESLTDNCSGKSTSWAMHYKRLLEVRMEERVFLPA